MHDDDSFSGSAAEVAAAEAEVHNMGTQAPAARDRLIDLELKLQTKEHAENRPLMDGLATTSSGASGLIPRESDHSSQVGRLPTK